MRVRALSVLLSSLMLTAPAWADKLTVGVQQETTAVDPHFHNTAPNNQLALHIFDPLILTDEKLKPLPGLAESWKVISDTAWELKLRRNVKWHDGSSFTADDVVFTFERAPNVPGSPGSFGLFIRGKEATKLDDYTVRIETKEPYPLMLDDLANFVIISKKHGLGAKTEDYNSGKAAIGTGPYKFKSYRPGDFTTLEPNLAYWGSKPKWDEVTFKLITSDPSRVAALLSNTVDVIDHVPTIDIPALRKDARFAIHEVPSLYVVFLSIDSNRDLTPFVTDNAGKPLFPNPLRDQRVRRAMSMAINRPAIVDRIMGGSAVASGQMVQDGFFGYDPSLGPEKYDPDAARKLLAEAGYPDGFRLTLHSPSDRYVNDARIAEAIAQMFPRIGIKTELVTYPRSVFFTRATNGGELKTPAFSVYLTAISARTGESSSPMRAVIATYDPTGGGGTNNRGRYSNLRFDARMAEALRTLDDAKREAMLIEAQKIAMDDVALIPLHFQVNTWASKSNLVVKGRPDEVSLADFVTKR